MNVYFKYIALTTGLFLSSQAFSATVPAQTFSRANCKFLIPAPGLGYGYYNESVSFDLTTGNHKMGVATKQKEKLTNVTRQKDSGNVVGKRARAGYVDDSNDKRFWTVNGYHRETLDNGKKVYVNTVAQGCNLAIDQFF